MDTDERLRKLPETIKSMVDFEYWHSGGGVMVIKKECDNGNYIMCGYGSDKIGCDIMLNDGGYSGISEETEFDQSTIEMDAEFAMKFAVKSCSIDI